MIRVTVELISAQDPSRDRLLGIAEIANEGPSARTPRFCKYSVRLSKWAPKEKQTWARGTILLDADAETGLVESFDRNSRGAWDLLYLALRVVVGTRNL